MKRFILLAAFLGACQPAGEVDKMSPEPKATSNPKAEITKLEVKSDVVRLRLNPPVSETRACIIPISVENGLASATRVTMIGFNLTGPGEDGRGNMFAPVTDPGEISDARVIVEGQSCDAFDTLMIPEIRCTSGEESCEDKVELIDGEALRFARSG